MVCHGYPLLAPKPSSHVPRSPLVRSSPGSSLSSFPNSAWERTSWKLRFKCGTARETEFREQAFPNRVWERGSDAAPTRHQTKHRRDDGGKSCACERRKTGRDDPLANPKPGRGSIKPLAQVFRLGGSRRPNATAPWRSNRATRRPESPTAVAEQTSRRWAVAFLFRDQVGSTSSWIP